jgi:hypothetical protein
MAEVTRRNAYDDTYRCQMVCRSYDGISGVASLQRKQVRATQGPGRVLTWMYAQCAQSDLSGVLSLRQASLCAPLVSHVTQTCLAVNETCKWK